MKTDTHTSKEVLTHLFVNVLELHSDDITALKNTGGMWNYKKLDRTSYDFLNKLFKSNDITLAALQYLSDWKMYVDETKPSTDAIMAMTCDSWDLVDVTVLRINHTLTKSTLTTKSSPTVTADTVTASQIEATNFLKYCNVSLRDKSQILNFYDNLVTQATGYNIFLRPSIEITPLDGVVPDFISYDCERMTATALYSKLSQNDTIAIDYADAHNMLATTTNGYEFLQLIIQQVHPLLAIKNIATIDIPKYSSFNNLFRYAREVKAYVNNHSLKQRSFSNKEVTHIFLSHLDDDKYSTAVKQCEMAILHALIIDDIYLVPAIAGTIDQLTPSPPATHVPPGPPIHPHRRRQDDRIRQLTDYCEDDAIDASSFDEYVDVQEEPPWIRSFRRGGGRTPYGRFGGGRGRTQQGRYSGTNNSHSSPQPYKGKCNSCGMSGHHSDSCHFLLKLRQALTYLRMDPQAPLKKKAHFRGRNSYQKNNNYVRSLQDAGFIPFDGADADNFIDVVDNDHEVFSPDIINDIETPAV